MQQFEIVLKQISREILQKKSMDGVNGTVASTDPPIKYSILEQVHSGFLILVVITAVLGNGFVCMAVYKVRRLQKVSNYFLVSLAVSDILFALFSIPFRIYFELNIEWQLGEHACKFYIFMDMLCSTASIVNLSLISVDRYLALSQSLRYLTIATVSRCRIGIAIVWGFSLANPVFALHSWSPDSKFVYEKTCKKIDKLFYAVSTTLSIIIPLIVLIVLYCLVFKIALAQQSKILKNEYVTPPSSEDGHANRPQRPRSNTSPRRFAIRELKATKTLMIVVGAFLVCWLPLFVLVILQQYAPKYVENFPPKTQEILGLLFLYSLPQLNCCLNPYIYTCHNAEFREVFKIMIGKILPILKLKSKNDESLGPITEDHDLVSTAGL